MRKTMTRQGKINKYINKQVDETHKKDVKRVGDVMMMMIIKKGRVY